jgi:hypothetical protein
LDLDLDLDLGTHLYAIPERPERLSIGRLDGVARGIQSREPDVHFLGPAFLGPNDADWHLSDVSHAVEKLVGGMQP